MAKNNYRVVIDTNLWISFLISNKYPELELLLKSDKLILLFNSELMEEILEVTDRPKMRKYFQLSDVFNLLH